MKHQEPVPGDVVQVFRPAVDVWKSADAIEIVVDMPGVSPERLDVTLDGTDLSLDGRAPEAAGALLGNVELPRRFRRVVRLDEPVNREEIRATLNDGVLRVWLPRPAAAQARRINVEGAR